MITRRMGIMAAALRGAAPFSARRGGISPGRGGYGRAMLRAALGGTALAGLAALGAGCPLCKGTDIGCGDGATISGPIGVAADTSAHLTIRACWNGRCGEAALTADQAASQGTVGGSAVVDIEGGVFHCTLWDVDRTNTQWELQIDFEPGVDTELEDGDVYAISVSDADTGRELVSFERSVDYEEQQPNGEGPFCTSCNAVQIEIPPPAAR
ncbi:hypothetical protein WMF31_24490 [Sorangium sp. So ce1036]|uniref:hypothetical protein n=1 Tax=Sorangium sp. So ce1036 TaxID=3133328 RepID=UPI003F0A5231